jgi:hypothetical protein
MVSSAPTKNSEKLEPEFAPGEFLEDLQWSKAFIFFPRSSKGVHEVAS